MKTRHAHLRIRRVGEHEWAVEVVVADGCWRIATTGTVAEALTIAVEKVQERQTPISEVPS